MNFLIEIVFKLKSPGSQRVKPMLFVHAIVYLASVLRKIPQCGVRNSLVNSADKNKITDPYKYQKTMHK